MTCFILVLFIRFLLQDANDTSFANKTTCAITDLFTPQADILQASTCQQLIR